MQLKLLFWNSMRYGFKYMCGVILFAAIALLLQSCVRTPNYLDTGGRLSFSIDTLLFDTVFTEAKSSTHRLWLHNEQSEFVTVSVYLKHGDASSYDLSIDGKTGKHISQIDIAPDDSTLVMVTMYADPTDDDLPFIIEDELIAELNDGLFSIPILGYGQNAYYIRDSVLTTSTFLADRPYVIVQSALVAEGHTLTIPAGATIYMHRDSRLFVQGSLKILGTLENPVHIQGDRIDRRIYVGDYLYLPGEWGGIYFTAESHDNEMHYARIQHGGLSTNVGASTTLPALVQVDEDTRMDGTPKLKMTHTLIHNAVAYGLVAFQSSIEAENCMIMNAQDLTLALLQGGHYRFYDCTIGAPGGHRFFSRSIGSVSVVVQNYYMLTESTYRAADLDAVFQNCILYGRQDEEFIASAKPDYLAAVVLDHCLVKHQESLPDFVTQIGVLRNLDPEFKDLTTSDFNLQASSPVIGKGVTAGVIPTDYNGQARPAVPAIGAVEFQP